MRLVPFRFKCPEFNAQCGACCKNVSFKILSLSYQKKDCREGYENDKDLKRRIFATYNSHIDQPDPSMPRFSLVAVSAMYRGQTTVTTPLAKPVNTRPENM